MIDRGAKIKVVDVQAWYDAGKLDTLLETNGAMLARGGARRPSDVGDARIIEPVYIEDGVTLREATVGPNVSIGRGTVVERSELRDTIVGEKATIRGARLARSLIGDSAVIDGVSGEVTVGDHSEIRVK